jgi:cell wall-associated protease
VVSVTAKVALINKIFIMKKILFIIIAQLFVLIAVSQISISNTKWLVHTDVPQSRNLVLDFKKDTIRILDEQGNETSSATFLQHNESLLIRKVSGRSPCPDGSEGWYRIEWLENGEKFLLHVINEDCRYRIYGQLKVIRKIKEPN